MNVDKMVEIASKWKRIGRQRVCRARSGLNKDELVAPGRSRTEKLVIEKNCRRLRYLEHVQVKGTNMRVCDHESQIVG